jgi:hypothetical protein
LSGSVLRALRRSEVAAIDVADVHEEPQGLHIDLPRSKANQEGGEEFVLIHRATDPAFCAVLAVESWRAALASLGIVDGRVFRRIERHGKVLGVRRPHVDPAARADAGAVRAQIGGTTIRAA